MVMVWLCSSWWDLHWQSCFGCCLQAVADMTILNHTRAVLTPDTTLSIGLPRPVRILIKVPHAALDKLSDIEQAVHVKLAHAAIDVPVSLAGDGRICGPSSSAQLQQHQGASYSASTRATYNDGVVTDIERFTDAGLELVVKVRTVLPCGIDTSK